MNILNRKQYQRGVGLTEVLIALVVIAVGVIAVLGLQGTLMSGSATSKARNEAVALAREKTEVLRNAIERDQFDTELAEKGLTDSPVETVDGVNAQFTRSWRIVNVASVENTRELVMQVTWVDAQGVYDIVELNTLISFINPLNMALDMRGDSNLSRVPNSQTGYEGRLLVDTPDTAIGGDISVDADDKYGITIQRYSNGHVQVRIPYIDGDYCSPQDLVKEVDSKYCVVFTAFGGTLLRFGGTVYVDNYLSGKDGDAFDATLLVKATSPAYCAHQELESACEEIDNKKSEMNCVEYLCYASGDCSIRDGDGDGDGTGGGGDCPTGTDAELEALNLPDLNGGWYGKVGYYYPFETSNNYPTVCMSKSQAVDDDGNLVWDDNDDVVLGDNKILARSYHSFRTAPGQKWDEESQSYKEVDLDWHEGINQSFLSHNTLIVDTVSNSDAVCDDGYNKMVSAGIVWNSFVGPKVIRDVTGVDNTVQDTDTTYRDIVAIYGAVLFPGDDVIKIKENVTAKPLPSSKITFDTVRAEGSADGVCKTLGSVLKGVIYACNFIDDQWSGYITASADPRPYDVTTTDPDTGLSTTETVDFTCEGSRYYAFDAPARNSGEDLSIICFPSP